MLPFKHVNFKSFDKPSFQCSYENRSLSSSPPSLLKKSTSSSKWYNSGEIFSWINLNFALTRIRHLSFFLMLFSSFSHSSYERFPSMSFLHACSFIFLLKQIKIGLDLSAKTMKFSFVYSFLFLRVKIDHLCHQSWSGIVDDMEFCLKPFEYSWFVTILLKEIIQEGKGIFLQVSDLFSLLKQDSWIQDPSCFILGPLSQNRLICIYFIFKLIWNNPIIFQKCMINFITW